MSIFEIPPSGGGGPFLPLRFWHGLLALALSVVLMIPLSLTVEFFFEPGPAGHDWFLLTLSTLLINVAFAGCAIWMLRQRGWPVRPVLLGLTPSAQVMALAIVGVIPAGVFADEAVFFLHRVFPDVFSSELIVYANALFSSAPLHGVILLGVAIAVAPAIGEELMFRGVILQSFRRDMPAAWSVLYSSILFGLIHFDWMQGTAAGLIGIYLGCVTVWTRSIYPAMAAHCVNNLLAVWMARTGALGLSEGALTGYSLPVLIVAAAILVLIMYSLFRTRIR